MNRKFILRKKAIIPVAALVIALSAAGCSATTTDAETTVTETETTQSAASITQTTETEAQASADIAAAQTTSLSVAATDIFSDRDLEQGYDASSAVAITLNGSSATSDSAAVSVDGSTVTITAEGTYVLSGTLDYGMIIVDVADTEKVQLVLDGVQISSSTSAAIYVKQADKVFVTTTDGSVNTLSNGGSFEAIDENNIDAVIFSKDDLTLNGNGELIIESPAGHGIVAKDSLKVTGGTYDITAASHALDANDEVSIAAGDFNITSGKDGIHAENTDTSTGYVYIEGGSFVINAEGDGISGLEYVQVEGGDFDITAGGGSENGETHTNQMGGFGGGGPMRGMQAATETTDSSSTTSDSYKGIKSDGELTINDGVFNIDSADDAVHSNGNITIGGGTFEITTGDDAFHSDETLTFNGGSVNVAESYEGLEGMNIIVNDGEINIYATDDGLNAAGGTDQSGFGGRGGDNFGNASTSSVIQINGGTLDITANGDGLDSNGSLEITGGYTRVSGPTSGDTATLDYDGTGVISGGTFIGTGAAGMAQSISGSGQGVIAVSAGNVAAGTEISLADESGNEITSFTSDLDSNVIIISDSAIVQGGSYTLTIGSESNAVTAQ